MAKPKLNEQQCAEVFRSIGNETRLRLLESLLAQKKCVTDLVEEIGKGQPHISHHLRILREAGLVEGRREGQRICYRIRSPIQSQFSQNPKQSIDLGCCRISFPVRSASGSAPPLRLSKS